MDMRDALRNDELYESIDDARCASWLLGVPRTREAAPALCRQVLWHGWS